MAGLEPASYPVPKTGEVTTPQHPIIIVIICLCDDYYHRPFFFSTDKKWWILLESNQLCMHGLNLTLPSVKYPYTGRFGSPRLSFRQPLIKSRITFSLRFADEPP